VIRDLGWVLGNGFAPFRLLTPFSHEKGDWLLFEKRDRHLFVKKGASPEKVACPHFHGNEDASKKKFGRHREEGYIIRLWFLPRVIL